MKIYGGVEGKVHVGDEFSALSAKKESPVPNGQEAGWVPEPVWTPWRRKPCLYWDLNSVPSAVQPVASNYADCDLPAPVYTESRHNTSVRASNLTSWTYHSVLRMWGPGFTPIHSGQYALRFLYAIMFAWTSMETNPSAGIQICELHRIAFSHHGLPSLIHHITTCSSADFPAQRRAEVHGFDPGSVPVLQSGAPSGYTTYITLSAMGTAQTSFRFPKCDYRLRF
jgi:hypothetical protein